MFSALLAELTDSSSDNSVKAAAAATSENWYLSFSLIQCLKHTQQVAYVLHVKSGVEFML